MKELGLDGHVYQPKDPFPKRLYSHRCLGVAIFYSTQIFEKTAEMRVFLPEQVGRLRVSNGRKRKRSDGVETMDGAVEGDATAGAEQDVESASKEHFLELDGKSGTRRVEECGRVDLSTASRLEQDLDGKPDAAVMVRLRLKQTGLGIDGVSGGGGETGGERSITLVCAHLWFDPFRPDLKTAQCRLLFDAIQRFHETCGVSVSDKAGSELHSAGQHQQEAVGPTNLILCGDFNSVPVVNPEFLPGPLKTKAEALIAAHATAEGSSTATLGLPRSSDIYPPSNAMASGVYSLLSHGYVSYTHPEHPDAFIPELMKLENAAGDGVIAWKSTPQKGLLPDTPGSHRPSGDWRSGYGTCLEDVYRNRGAGAPCFTTKTSQFSGVIDHIFVSSKEKGSGLAVTGVLAFPPGADLTDLTAKTGTVGGTEHVAKPGCVQSDGLEHGHTPADEAQVEKFGPIPDEVWGSDHLALGVEVAVI